MGLATIQLLVAAGAGVVGAARSDRGLAAIAAAGGEPFRCDVTDAGDRAGLVAAAGSLHGLVMSHGETTGQAIDSVSEADFDRLVGSNLKSVFFLLQAFAPRLPDHGAAVVISSIAGKTGTIPEVAVYAAAKAGVDSLTRSFAHAHAARGMRVNAVVPGIIDTAMQRHFLELNAPLRGLTPDEYHAQRTEALPMKRAGAPAEAAEVIAFLLSERASYLTGQTVNLAGGSVTW